jgi:hypothetical protein
MRSKTPKRILSAKWGEVARPFTAMAGVCGKRHRELEQSQPEAAGASARRESWSPHQDLRDTAATKR